MQFSVPMATYTHFPNMLFAILHTYYVNADKNLLSQGYKLCKYLTAQSEVIFP
jgi:hypothetical protein